MLFYSKTTRGFYDDAIHTEAQIPSDAVEITQEEHQALMVAQSEGKIIQPDANGAPEAVDFVPTTAQQWAAYQQGAQKGLSDSDTTMHRIAEGVALGRTSWTAADVVAWVDYRRLLRSILSEAQPATIPQALPAKPAYPAGT